MNERPRHPSSSTAGDPAGSRKSWNRLSISLMELEQRIAFDAAGAATVEKTQQADTEPAAPVRDQQEGAADIDHAALVEALKQPVDVSSETQPLDVSQADHPTQVVFVDSSVPDYDKLLQNIGGDYEVVVLDANQDGVEQMANVLKDMKDVEAIHIISHGSQGSLSLGSATVTANSMMGEYADEFRGLRSSLSEDADILIYGCDFAEGETGAVAADMMGRLTGADIAASDDRTGAAALGGDWDLEYRFGDVTTDLAVNRDTQDSFADLLTAPASTGDGALLISVNKTIYSVDVLTGKATALTTVPATVGGIAVSATINSLAVDQANGLIYYTDSDGVATNRALFAYDYINNTHIVIDSNLTDNGAGASITVGTTGVGSGAAAFYNGALYLGVENITGANDQIFKITFTNGGRTVSTASTFGAQITATNDWGDFAIDSANNALLSISGTTVTRYSLVDGTSPGSYTISVTGAQGGGDLNGNTYLVGNVIQRINPLTGATVGSAVTVTTNGSTALTGASDATTWTPATGSIGDKIFDDNNSNGTFDAGDVGLGNVTVQLIDDIDGDGVVDAGERVLATDTTDANGNYLFTNVLPGQYIVRVTDANGVVNSAPSTTGGLTRTASLALIGASSLAADFGFAVAAPIVDLNSGLTTSDVVTNGGFSGTTGWVVGGTGGTTSNGFAWTTDNSTGTLTQSGISGWNLGQAPSGSAQLVFDFGWNNGSPDNSSVATLEISVGGVIYARITSGASGSTTATIAYLNGATGSPATVTATTFGSWTTVPITINLPTTVSATGDLQFSYNSGGNILIPGRDDFFIDNVRALTLVDATAGVDFATSYTENGAGVSISDTDNTVRDSDSANMRSATIVLTNALAGDVLNVGSLPAGISAVTDTSVAGQITIRLTGVASKADYATAIRAITFSNTGDNPSATNRIINVTVNDGAQNSAVATTTITVAAVNDAPVNSLPGSGWTTNEDTSVALNGLSIADPDVGSSAVTVTLSVGSGTLSAASAGGVTVSGSGTGTVVLSGTLANINAYLATASAPVYTPVANANGPITLTMVTNDGGNTGTGGVLTDTDVRTITITPINDAPTVDLNGDPAVSVPVSNGGVFSQPSVDAGAERTNTLTFTVVSNQLADQTRAVVAMTTVDDAFRIVINGRAITSGAIGVDAGNAAATRLTFADGSSVVSGWVANSNGLARVEVRITEAGIEFWGTRTSTSTALEQLFYPTGTGGLLALPDFIAGANTIVIANPDGSGPESISGVVTVTTQDVDFSSTYTEGGAGAAIADLDRVVGDIDDTNMESASIIITNGKVGDILSVTGGLPAGITANWNAATFTLTLTGSATKAAYEAAIGQIRYSSTSDNPTLGGSATSRTINVTVNDGDINSNTAVATIAITAVNDAPVNTLPSGGWTTNEDTSVTLTGLAVTDLDANGGTITVTLSVGSGTLNALAGGGVGVSGSGTATVTLTGTLTAINAYLASASAPVYVPVADANGPVTLTMTTNDAGNTGTGGPLTDIDTATITIVPVNDAPVLDLDASGAGTGFSTTYTENGAGVAIADTDSLITDIDSVNMASATVVIANGQAGDVLSIAGTLPAGITAVWNPATFTLTLSGSATKAAYETALEQVRYASTSENPSTTPRTVSVTVNDGAANSNTAIATVNVIAVNDAPVNTVPGPASVAEDVLTAISGISVADVDNGTVTVTLSVANGTLSPSVIAGTVTGNNTTTVTISGTVAEVNSVLASLRYQGNADYNGSDTLTVATSDGALSDTDTVAITVTPVADIVADNVATSEDTPISFNAITGTNGASADNFENAGRAITAVTQPPAGQGAVAFNADGTITYTPAANFNGITSFTYTVTSGGVTETATVTVTVNAVNDAPVNTLPALGWTTNEDTAAALTGLFVSDPDAGTGIITVRLDVGSGTLAASGGGGVAISGSGSSALTLTGTLADINAYLASASAPIFTPVANANGSVTLTMTTNDGGNTGTGGALTDVDTRTITVAAVNDAPVNTMPVSYATNEDTGLGLTGLQIADVDAASGTMTVVLTVSSGSLTATAGGSVTVAGSGTSSITLTGTLSNINAFLAGASRPTFIPAADFSGAVSLTMTTSDGGNTGAGGVLSDTDTRTITVNPVNDVPVLDLDASGAGTGYSTSYTENGAGVAIVDIDRLITDVDSANMASATIVISNGQSGDLLSVAGALPAGITASWNPATFTLTLTGSASKAAYETALEQVRYSSTSDDPSTAARTINLVVNDGSADSNVAVATVSVTAVNDAPVNTLPAAGWTADEDTVLSLTGLSVSDPDAGTNPVTVTLSVGSGTLAAGDSGAVTVTGSGSGTITLSGTLASINAYLASASRPTYLPIADFNGSVTLTMTSSDGSLSDTDTRTITVAPITDIANDTATTNEDTAVTINVNANDTFENSGHSITAINGISIVTNGIVTVANGTVRLNADGSLTFTPAADYNGNANFTYTVASGGVTETATVNVTVAPVNDAPVNTVPGAQTTLEDTPLAIGGITVNDVDGGTLTTTLTVTNGTLSVIAGGATVGGNGTATVTISGTAAQINAALAALTYNATADYYGPAQLTVQTSDGALSDTDFVAITVTPVADIVADSVTTNEDTPISFNVLTGTNGASADSFENPGRVVSAVTQPPAGQGTVTFNADGTITYTPAADFNGTTSFTYTVTSGGVTETTTVTVTVDPVNDAPVNTVPAAQATTEDTTLVFTSAAGNAITVADVDGDTLTVTVTVTNGTFSLSGTAGLTFSAGDGTADQTMTFSGSAAAINAAFAGAGYTPVADYNGSAQLTIQTSDGSLSNSDTIAISIAPVADIANDTASTAEDTPVTISVLANDSFENPARTISAVNGVAVIPGGPAVAVANGTVALNTAGQLIFTPTTDFNGNASFTYTVSSGGVTETATVNVAVASVNTPPVNTLPSAFATLEDTAVALTGLQVADADAGSGVISVTLSVDVGTLAATAAGGVAVNGSGTGTITLSGTLADINAYLAGATRPTFTPAANATAGVTLTMTTSDNGNTGGPALVDIDTATITITPVNDAPSGADRTATIAEDTTYTFTAADFGFSDPNDSPANALAAIVITSVPANGVLSLGGTPVTAGQVITAANIANLTWTPTANANGAALASFSFQVRDNGGTANGGQDTDLTPNIFTFNVTPVNDGPINTLPTSFGVNEDTALALTGLQVSDVDAGAGIVTITLGVSSGTLSASAGTGVSVTGSGSGTIVLTGTVGDLNAYLASTSRPTFNPTANFNGPVTLTMATSDGGNTGSGGVLADTDTAVITVAPVNDAPVGSDTAIVTNEDAPFTGTLPTATDVDGDALTYGAGGTAPSHGTVTINPNGSYTYTPAANFSGSDTFTYTVTDGTATVEYTVTVTVNPVNDAPVAVNDTAQTNANTSASVNVLANDTDVDGDALAVSQVNGASGNIGTAIAGSNGGTFTVGANGVAVFNPAGAFTDLAAGQTRTTSVTYQVSDGHGGVATATLTITVIGTDDAPVSTPIANQTSNDAQAVSFNVSGNFSDPDSGDTLTFTATGLPAGLTIDPATGVISGTIDRSASVTAPYSVTVIATDSTGLQASRTFTWTVLNPAPVARDDAAATTENSTLNGSVFTDNGSGVDSDPDGDPITVSAVNGSAGGVGAAIVGSNGGNFTINADGTYSFVPGTSFDDLAAGQTRTTSVTYTISDGQGGTATATVVVTVTGQNDAPVAVNDAFSTNEDTPVTFDVRTNDSDVDGGTITVTQINGTNIAPGSSVAVTGGTVTLNGDGTLTFTPALDFNGSPSFTYTITDGQGATATAAVGGTVNPVQDPPVAANDTFVTSEDIAVTFDVRTNDSDPDSDPLSVTQINGTNIAPGNSVAVTGGTVTLNADGTLTFTPAANFNGSPSFTYTVSDGHGGTATATASGTVSPVQDPPVAVNDTFTTNEDTAVSFDVRGNDSDPDGDALSVTQINGNNIAPGNSIAVTGGTVTLNADGTLTFTPSVNFNGSPSFTYTISDGQGGTATATVNGTVVAVNDAPVAVDDTFTTNEDTAAVFDVRVNDSDIEGDALSVTQINGQNIATGGSVAVSGGTVSLGADGRLTFTPTTDFHGAPSFTYTISDGHGGTATATVTGTVNPINDAPVAVNDTFTTNEDTAVTINVRVNDSDVDGDTIAVTQINSTAIAVGGSVAVTGGSVMLNADGTLTFVPAANFNGTPSFTYTISDGNGGTASATVSGTVVAVNDAPVSSDTTVTTPEDGTLNATLPAASDADGDTVTYSAGSTTPAHGTVTINPNGTYSYVPAPNFNGTDRFSFVVSDGNGGTNEYTVTVDVTPQNDAPVGTPIPNRSSQDGTAVSFNVAGFFTDVDGDTLSFTQGGLPAGLSISAGGVISGTIDRQASQGGPGANGIYSVTVTANDGHGGTTTQTFTFTIGNPPPVAVNDAATTNEDIPVTINVLDGSASGGTADSDPDGDPLTVTSASAANGAVIIGANGQITYVPNSNFNGTDTITYTISDGNGGTATATVTVTVNPVNDAPSGMPIADRTRNDSDTDSINASAFFADVDGDTLVYSVAGLPAGLTIDPATGLISGTIAHDASGPTGERVYTVTVTASDGHGGTTPITFRYTVLNIPPIAENDTATTTEDTPVEIPILANDSDPDGDDAEVIRVNNVVLTVGGPAVATSNGMVQLVLNGSNQQVLRFTPNTNYNGQESFTYTIDDGNSGVDTATVTVTVVAANDDPVVTNPIPDRVRADGQSFAYDTSDFFNDPDGDSLNYVITGLPAGLTYDPATGVISGTIDHNASQGGSGGVYAVTVTAYDRPGGTGLSVAQTFDLTVTNPRPIAINDTVTVNEDTPAIFNVLTGVGTTSGAAGADTDPDGDTLAVTAASAGNGTVTIGANGQLTYSPKANFNGTDTIIYTISDSQGGTSTATVTITVNAVNDTPTSHDIANRIDNDSQVIAPQSFAPYFEDIDGDTLTYTVTGLPPGLTFNAATGEVSGTIDSSASTGGPTSNGVYTVTIVASDGSLTATETFTWFIDNLPPTAFDDTLTVSEDAGATGGNVLANDIDPDGDGFAVSAVEGQAVAPGSPVTVAGSSGGTFTVNADGSYTFVAGPAFADLQAGETRTTTIVYTIRDDDGGLDTATLTVLVTGVNDSPTVDAIPSYTRADGQSMTSNPLNVSAFFHDVESDALTFNATGLPPGLSMDAAGNITGVIANNASVSGPYTVIVTANDGHGGTVEQRFTFNVTNPAPTAVNDTASTAEDTPINSINVLGNDTDPDGDTLFVDPSFPPQAGHGTVTINPDGTLKYVPDPDYNGTDTIVYRVSDGQGGFSTGVVTVSVGAENDPPSVTPIPDILRSDSDTFSLNVTGNFSDPEGDPLTYTITGLPPGLTYNPATGVISGKIAPDASGPTGRQTYIVTVAASDGFPGGSTSTQFAFVVENLAPEANNDVATTLEDTPVNIPVLANDLDPDGDTGVVISVNGVDLILNGPSVQTTNGSVQLVTDGTAMVLRFTPNPNYNGTESFTYTIDDGNSGVDTATVTITVTPVNDAPVAGTIPDLSRPDSTSINLDVSGYFSDVDGDDLDFAITGLPPGLTFDPETGVISGTLTAGASQGSPYTVTVVANDRDGGSGLSATTTFVFTVTNPAPVAGNDTVATNEDVAVTFNPITGAGTTSGTAGADIDPDGDPLVVTQIDGQPIAVNATVTVTNGTVRLNADGTLTFIPAANFNGTAVINYRVSDGNGGFDDASISVIVNAVNDAPSVDLNNSTPGTGNNSTYTEGDSPVLVANGDAVAFDVEDQIVDLDISLAGFVDGNAERIHLNGAVDIIYGTANSGTIDFGGTTFVFTYDGANGLHFENAAGATVPMTGGAVSALVRALQYDNTGDNPTTGARTLSFTVTDAEGATSPTAVATIAVAPVNDNPIAVNDTATTGENTQLAGAVPGVLGNDRDPEGDALTVTAVNGGAVGGAVTGSSGGSFIVNADGSYSFDPLTAFDDLKAGETRSTTVAYTISDGHGGTATATLTVVVTGANDAPVGANDNIVTAEDTPFSGTLPVASDVDGDTLTYAAATQPAHGTVSIGTNGTYVYTPAADYNGPDSFTYTVSDGTTLVTYTVSINVTPGQDAPVGRDIPDAAYSDAQAVSLNVSGYFTDIDGDTLTFSQAGLPAGLVFDPATGFITGQVASDASQVGGGVYAVTITATDTAGNTASETFAITITNPAPIARDDSIATAENMPVSGSVFANNGNGTDGDPDGDVIVVSAVNGVAVNVGTGVAGSTGGSFTVNANGTFNFDPGADFDTLKPGESRATSIVYTISDGQGGTSTATFTVTVHGQNDAPVGSNTSINAAEDTPFNGTLPVATDVDGDPLSYGVGSQPANGTVTVNPNGTYTYTPNGNYYGPDSFTYTVTDGTSVVTYTVSVTVGAVNDAPVAQDNAHTISEDTSVNGAISFTDIDNLPSQITVSLETVPASGTVVVNADGTYIYTPAANFHGTDSFVVRVADPAGGFDLATVTINVTPVNDAPVAVDDTAATTENAIASGNVILDVPGRDSDIDGDVLTVVGVGTVTGGVGSPVAGGNGGTFVIQPDGSFRFDPGADFDNLAAGQTRTTSITYTISDGQGGTDTATLVITVTGTNDAPNAATLPPQSNVDGATVSVSPGSAFSDIDVGDVLTFNVAGLPLGLNFDPATGTISGIIDRNASGPTGTQDYTVTVTADDGHGGTVARSFVWTVTNPGPDAVNDNLGVAEDGTLIGSVFADNGNGPDSDPDGDPLSVSLVTGPANGALVLNSDGTFTYNPGANFNGVDSFVYRVSDGNGGFDTATVTITVAPVNDAPVAGDDSFAIDEDGTIDIAVLGNDSDIDGDPLTVTEINGQSIVIGGAVAVTGGTVTLNADGTLRFTANPDFNGAPSFTYTVSDGTASAQATVRGTVGAVNDAPVNTLPPTFNGTEDQPLTLTGLSVSDADAGGGTTQVTLAVDAGVLTANSGAGVAVTGSGSASITLSGTLADINAYLAGGFAPVYVPVANSNAPVTLTMVADDRGNSGSGGALSDTDTVIILLQPVNDAPVASGNSHVTPEDTPVAGTVVASDVDGDALTFTLVAQPPNGTVKLDADGTYVYTPKADFSGTETFEVLVDDGHGGTTTATVTVIVTPVNDSPVGRDTAITVKEDTFAAGTLPPAVDPEGDPLTYGLGSQAGHGTVTVNPDGTYTYTPNPDYSGPDSFTYTVSDGSSTVTYTVSVNVTPVDDVPVGSDLAVGTDEDTPLAGKLPVALDPDGDPLTYGLGSQPGHGTATVNPAGTYTYTPSSNYNGPDSFTYTVSDGTSTVTYTVFIDVRPVNDAPVGSSVGIDVDEGTSLSGKLPVAIDPDGHPLTYGAGSQPGHGTVTINPDGTYTYTPDPGYNGADNFTYTVSDGTTTVFYTVTVNVRASGEPPTLEIDPPVVFPERREEISERPGIAVQGEILRSIGDLGGISDRITADGPIDSVVNAFGTLNGISGLPAEGVVHHVVKQIGEWSDSTRRVDDLIVEPLRGGSSIDVGSAGGERTWFKVDALFDQGFIYILISAQEGGAAVEFRVTQADGRALPEWLTATSRGVTIGHAPAGLPFIDLRVQAVADGGIVEDTFRVDLLTGTIIDHAADRSADLDSGFFSARLGKELDGGIEETNILARALQSWSSLDAT
ncbi:hypothetical protein CYK37_08820 [Mesorhizobium loti]|nr:Ig-like domain-containing protein [Mesorhizobium loti]PLP59418.1 hypothetical protein CYK37_08820 [Mesorhizobium loti]